MAEIDAVVLAGGRSRRMGRDKALLPFGGYSTLAEYQYRRLLPLFRRVWISTKEPKFDFEAPLILDRESVSSPMVALAAILQSIDGAGALLLGVDMPFIPPELLGALTERFDSRKPGIILARSPRGPEPLCAIYPKRILPLVREKIDEKNHRLQNLLREEAVEIVDWEDPEAFRNLNHPEEYRRAISR
jgi:molybdopterin-guanine dinucleotide biosynthesis protein A